MILFFILSLCFFIVAITTHLLWCCILRSRNLQVIPFLVIALGYLAALNMISMRVCPPHVNYWGQSLIMSSNIIYFLLIPTYLIFYAATVIDSPSRTALRLIRDHKGLTYSEILKGLGGSEFIQTRLNSLLDYHLISVHENKYQLSSKGEQLGRLLNFLKFFLGRDPGG